MPTCATAGFKVGISEAAALAFARVQVLRTCDGWHGGISVAAACSRSKKLGR